ncbi:hypothetical protein [Runella sp.]|uniref:hypothetical protein n=1 Tax=Runella sp. TaxID=1960881 RepID=UPI003D1148C2
MGYFIERSLSVNSGFVPVGGVKPNTATFMDATVLLNTPYYYRIRPSNTTTGHLSNVSGVFTGVCTTMYTLKEGNWNDPSVWSCGRLPTQNDKVEINHTVTVPENYEAMASDLLFNASARLI